MQTPKIQTIRTASLRNIIKLFYNYPLSLQYIQKQIDGSKIFACKFLLFARDVNFLSDHYCFFKTSSMGWSLLDGGVLDNLHYTLERILTHISQFPSRCRSTGEFLLSSLGVAPRRSKVIWRRKTHLFAIRKFSSGLKNSNLMLALCIGVFCGAWSRAQSDRSPVTSCHW